jgi:hypothetical protein
MSDYWWPFAARHHRLVTKLTPEQCYERLQPRVKLLPFWPTRLRSRYVRGAVSPTSFSIRKGIGYSNPLQTVAIGHCRAIPQGTEISVSLSADEASIGFLGVWFGGVFLFLFWQVAEWLASRPGHRPSVGFIIAPVCMLLMGYLITVQWRRQAAGETDQLLQFLKGTLHAKDAADETQPAL